MYKSLKNIIIVALLLVISAGSLWAANDPPCKYPPFLGKSAVIPPHIIFVMDYSGSMSWMPYPNDLRDSRTYNHTYHDTIYFGGKKLTYAGQFKPYVYYKYNTDDDYFEEVRHRNPGEPPVKESERLIDGNFLNFSQNMSRITILKLVLMGDNNYTYSTPTPPDGKIIVKLIKQDRSSCYYFDSRHRLKITYDGGTKRGDGNEANPYIGGTVTIEKQVRRGRRWRLEERWVDDARAALLKDEVDARGIFEQFLDKDMDGNTDVDAPSVSIITYQGSKAAIRVRKSRDINTLENALHLTYAHGATPTKYGVQKAASIVSNASHNPSSDIYYEYVNSVAMGLYCKKVYEIVMTDGNWNRGGDPLEDVHDDHTDDLRGDLINDAGKQTIDFFSIFMFGSGGGLNSQKWIALFGGFQDVYDGNGWPGTYTHRPRSSQSTFDGYNHRAEADTLEWDNDGDALPDHFYEVYNADQMRDAFQSILNKIKATVASASAAPNTPAASAKGEGMAFQAVFMPALKDPITNERRYWLGELRALFVDPKGNLREDTDGDKVLDLKKDRVLTFYYDAGVQRIRAATYADLNGNGVIDSTELSTELRKEVFDINTLWKASDWLNSHSESSRRIFYLDDNLNLKAFTTAEANNLKDYFALSQAQADSLIRFVRGVDFTDAYRKRDINGVVWKLGDIIHSTPTYLSTPMERYDILYGDDSYRDYYKAYKGKRGVLFVGANDGMLHAFNAGVFEPDNDDIRLGSVVSKLPGHSIGEELWAIIPHSLIPHLRWLWRKEYDVCHVYYVDGKPKLTDLKIFGNDAVHINGWGTVLTVGYNFGGDTITADGNTFRSAYDVIDVTDPLNPVPLVEFTDAGLGFTTGYPAFGKVDSAWYMFVGSGPNKLSGLSDQRATFYIIKSDGTIYHFGGNNFTHNYNAYIGSPTSVDLNLDYNVDVIYFGVNYYSGGRWYGQLYKFVTHDDPDPYTWTISKVVDVNGPITSPPSISKDEKGRTWVFFGTGKYMGPPDAVDSTVQYIVGVKDEGTYVSWSSLLDVTDARLFVPADSIELGGKTWTFNEFERYADSFAGWYVRLPLGERVLEKAALVGGALFVSTYSPVASAAGNPCDAGNVAFGGGHLYALYFKTGTAHPAKILGEQSGEALKSVSIGGMPSSPEVHVGEHGEVTVSVQTSEGAVQTFNVNLPFSIKSGVKLWKGGL